MKRAYYLVALWCCLSVVRADTIGGYTFTLDGKPLDPGLLTREQTEPVSGDVAYVERMPLCLDEPGDYHFTFNDGMLLRTMSDGRSVVVACEVAAQAEKAEVKAITKVVNPLAGMDDKALRALRGVTLNAWPEGIEKQLARLDLEHVCLQIGSDVLRVNPDKLPAIPEGVRTLLLNSGGTWNCEDHSGLAGLKKLRFLDLQQTSLNRFDFAVLKGLPLEYLGLPWTSTPVHVEVLEQCVELKTLAANYCNFLGDGRWLAQLSNLRQLYASHVRAAEGQDPVELDLAALSGLEKLGAFHVQSSPVKSLPTTPMPNLKKASLLLSSASKEIIDAFAKANPQTVVARSMNGELLTRLAKADRVRARTGGVCHRRAEKEKVIYETADAAQIKELAQLFQVAESTSGGHCMCCGNPTFEFYEGEKQVAMIGFHHGRSIRWADGVWPGDGMLTSLSADSLVDWLARHHYNEPQDELREGRRREAAALRRDNRYDALLPTDIKEVLNQAESLEQVTAAFEKKMPDARDRANLYLRLFGCDEGTWALSTGMDEPLAGNWLPSIPADTLQSVIREAKDRTEEGLGAIRWVFGEAHADVWKDKPEVLQRLARFALTHPRQGNRWRTLTVLRDLGTPEAIVLLREVMKGGTTPRKLSDDEAVEAGGQMTFYPGNITLPDNSTDAAAAALCLDMINDTESKGVIAKIRNGLSADARKAWDESLQKK